MAELRPEALTLWLKVLSRASWSAFTDILLQTLAVRQIEPQAMCLSPTPPSTLIPPQATPVIWTFLPLPSSFSCYLPPYPVLREQLQDPLKRSEILLVLTPKYFSGWSNFLYYHIFCPSSSHHFGRGKSLNYCKSFLISCSSECCLRTTIFQIRLSSRSLL